MENLQERYNQMSCYQFRAMTVDLLVGSILLYLVAAFKFQLPGSTQLGSTIEKVGLVNAITVLSFIIFMSGIINMLDIVYH